MRPSARTSTRSASSAARSTMRHHQHRHSVRSQPADHGGDFACQFGIECRGRLVQNEEVGSCSHGAGNRSTLCLTARQLRGIGIALVGQIDIEQRLISGRFRVALRPAVSETEDIDDVLALTVRCEKRLNCWKTNRICRRTDACACGPDDACPRQANQTEAVRDQPAQADRSCEAGLFCRRLTAR